MTEARPQPTLKAFDIVKLPGDLVQRKYRIYAGEVLPAEGVVRYVNHVRDYVFYPSLKEAGYNQVDMSNVVHDLLPLCDDMGLPMQEGFEVTFTVAATKGAIVLQ